MSLLKYTCFFGSAFFISSVALADEQREATDWYWGYGTLYSDFTDFTTADAEASALTITKQEQKPVGASIFTGRRINKNMNFELSIEAHGKQETIGTLSGATLKSKAETFGLYPSSIMKPENEIMGLTPYLRLGYGIGRSESKTIKTNAVGVFSNPNNTSNTEIGSNFIYGVGVDYNLSNNTAIRLDYKVNKNGQVDYIDNIDNGYIRRDWRTVGIYLKHSFGEDEQQAEADIPAGYSIGMFVGNSSTDARMSGGSYSGNIYNLTTGAVVTTVSGSMTDDKNDVAKKLVLFKEIGNHFSLQTGLTHFGEFKSRSANLGITGGGNALTGATTRSVLSMEASIGYPISLGDSFKLVPSVGAGMFYVDDEIYNNLEFDGVGGSDRGPKSSSTRVNLIAGLMATFAINEDLDFAIRYDYANDVGHTSGLGKGSLTTATIGLISKF